MRRLLSKWCDSDNQSHLLEPKPIVSKRTQKHTHARIHTCRNLSQDVPFISWETERYGICTNALLCSAVWLTRTHKQKIRTLIRSRQQHNVIDLSQTVKSVYIRWLKWWDAIFLFSLLNYSKYLFLHTHTHLTFFLFFIIIICYYTYIVSSCLFIFFRPTCYIGIDVVLFNWSWIFTCFI